MNAALFTIPVLSLALCAAADLRTGYYRGQPIQFENQGGLAVFEGDIILGSTAEIENFAASSKEGSTRESTGVIWQSLLWPNGVIPYTIDPLFSAAQRAEILEAIRHWNENTPIRLIERTNETNGVQFLTDNDAYSCRSTIGMSTRAQILLPQGCGLVAIIHEIGHTVGLWHEHTRTDRNRFVTIVYENMERRYASQFDERAGNARDLGPYDFSSIMHYGPWDFGSEPSAQVMETVPAGIEFGGVRRLSAGDLAAVRTMYEKPVSRVTVATTPPGLRLRVDGAVVNDGTTFEWAAGSQHTIEAPFQGDNATRYVFANWSHGGPAVQTITATPGAVWVANFVTQHRVVASFFPPGGGTVSIDPPSSDGFYPLRARLRVTATPADGFQLLRWSTSTSRSANPRWFTLTGPSAISATFVREEVTTLATDPPGRVLTVDGVSMSAPASFAWVRGESHTVGIGSLESGFVRYRFAGWTDGASQTRTITGTGSAATYTAKFVRQFQLTVQTNSTANSVAVLPSSPDGYYDEGAVLQLTAQPARFFAFLGWSGDLAGSATTVTLVMDSQKVVQAAFGSAGQVRTLAVVGAATGSDAAIAPGQLVSIYGTGIGPASPQSLQVRDGRVQGELATAQVLFDGQPAPITYASADQINAVVPYGIAGKTMVTVLTRNGGKTSTLILVPVREAMPGIFTADASGRGQGAILNQNGTFNSPSNPARRGSVIVIYATGEGTVTPSVQDGQVSTAVYPKPVLPVSARIGGQPAVVYYAGAAPNFVSGLLQMNVQVPETTATGPRVPITLVIGNQSSPMGVTVAIE
jgi:uncharacterized protein (TIGR03437 family)